MEPLTVTGIISVLAAAIGSIFGGIDILIVVLFWFVFLDTALGIIKSLKGQSTYTKSGKFSSHIAAYGFIYKIIIYSICIFFAVGLGYVMEYMGISIPYLEMTVRDGIILFLIFVEASSILENLNAVGLPLPAWVSDVLDKVKITPNKSEIYTDEAREENHPLKEENKQ